MIYEGDVIRLFDETEYYRVTEVRSSYRNDYADDTLQLSDGRVVPIMKVASVKLSDEMPKLSDDEIDAKLSAIERAMFSDEGVIG